MGLGGFLLLYCNSFEAPVFWLGSFLIFGQKLMNGEGEEVEGCNKNVLVCI